MTTSFNNTFLEKQIKQKTQMLRGSSRSPFATTIASTTKKDQGIGVQTTQSISINDYKSIMDLNGNKTSQTMLTESSDNIGMTSAFRSQSSMMLQSNYSAKNRKLFNIRTKLASNYARDNHNSNLAGSSSVEARPRQGDYDNFTTVTSKPLY